MQLKTYFQEVAYVILAANGSPSNHFRWDAGDQAWFGQDRLQPWMGNESL